MAVGHGERSGRRWEEVGGDQIYGLAWMIVLVSHNLPVYKLIPVLFNIFILL